MNPRLVRNNFDLLRFLLAFSVFIAHAAALTDNIEMSELLMHVPPIPAVPAFFVISGFLIFMSYERSSSLRSYVEKRARRLVPAYVTVVLLGAIGLAAVSSAQSYFASAHWLKYTAANLIFLNFVEPTLPGVFTGNPINAVNGALWTLKIEVMFYLCVPGFVWLFRRFGHVRIIVATYLLSIAWARYVPGELGRQLPGQLSYFMAGTLCYYQLARVEKNIVWLVPAAALLYLVPPVQPLALGMLVIFLGLWGYVGNFGKHGDFSYGLYIVHYPVLQLFIHFGLFRDSPYLAMLAATIVVLIASVLLWKFVESRWLGRRSHYIEATRMDDAPGQGEAGGPGEQAVPDQVNGR